MAEGALFHLAGNVSNVLGSFIAEEVKLAFGVKTEIENLKSRVSTIQAVLLDAEKRSSQNRVIKNWLGKLKEVLHDADDVLDDFSTEVLRHKVMSGNKMIKEVRVFFSSSNQPAFGLNLGHEIKAISERLNAIEKEMMAYQFSQSLVEPQVMNRADRETYSFVLKDEVFGREHDKKKIMERLFDDSVEEYISIIPIVGIGGLGKTTLAQLVYNDENVQTKFEIKLWVCISDIFDVQRIVKEIVEQLIGGKHEGSLEILQNKLREKLNGKKYLIILDDLWNEDSNKWRRLIDLLMVGSRGSRIVVTTRSTKVAEITGATSPYELKGLVLEKAWPLFVKMAFKGGKEPENQILVALGKQIVGKCIGVPLAIRTIGSLLNGKTSEIEWQSFLENGLSKLTQQENDISLTLKLSYDYLPSHLKQCFAYCRLFPKDYRIDVNTLIDLWIAQGFIVLEDSRQRYVDIGRKYFIELLWRSFFQEVEIDVLDNIKSCKMHDLMHDLAIFVSGAESAILNSSEKNVIKNVRHVSFDLVNSFGLGLVDSLSQFSILGANKRKIRTVLAISEMRKLGMCILTCDALISNLNYIRTLDLHFVELHVVPDSIGELNHLRYLDLSDTDIKFLPNSITKLLNLQTLKLSDCRSLKELPRGLKNLVNLRHLDVSGCSELTHMPLGLGHLISLEILPWFVVRDGGSKASSSSWYKKKQAKSGGGLSELKELSNLGGSLFIKNLGHGEDDMVECKATNMKEKQHLQELDLCWDEKWDDGETESYDYMSLEGLQPPPNLKRLKLSYYMGVRIPNWVSSLANLVHFYLYDNKRLQHLQSLNQLPFLKVVSLWRMEALEYISDEDSVSNLLGAPSSSSSSSSKTLFFPSLYYLRIHECPKLKGWWRNSDDDDDNHLLLPSFPPCLSKLRIQDCPKQGRAGGGLSELKELSNLGESLLILFLGHGEDDIVECKATNMKQKQHLQVLELWWDLEWDDGETEFYDDMSLEELQPHPNLKVLELRHYMGVRIPSWVSSLTNLVRFSLHNNRRLQHLPPLNQLPFLKSVWLYGMEALEYIWIDVESVSNVLGASSSSSSSSSKTPFFPSLSSLRIGECPKLKGWWRNSDDDDDYDNEPHHLLLPSFPPSLSKLDIWGCPNLTYMPPFPYLKERLNLSGCSGKVLEQTMKMGAATTSTYFPPLSQLRELNLSQMIDFESLPEEGLRNLVSLQKLSIQSCDGLSSLHWIGSLTSLQFLKIYECPNLTSHPQEIHSLTSLERLTISGCPKLTSLPPEIRNLTSLKQLTIRDCPLLGQRCKRQIGEDWPFIAHVLSVFVDDQNINQQEETISSESESESEL